MTKTDGAKLSDAHLYAIRTFDNFPLGSEEIETIDLDAGLEVIAGKHVALSCGGLLAPLFLKATETGRRALGKEG